MDQRDRFTVRSTQLVVLHRPIGGSRFPAIGRGRSTPGLVITITPVGIYAATKKMRVYAVWSATLFCSESSGDWTEGPHSPSSAAAPAPSGRRRTEESMTGVVLHPPAEIATFSLVSRFGLCGLCYYYYCCFFVVAVVFATNTIRSTFYKQKQPQYFPPPPPHMHARPTPFHPFSFLHHCTTPPASNYLSPPHNRISPRITTSLSSSPTYLEK